MIAFDDDYTFLTLKALHNKLNQPSAFKSVIGKITDELDYHL